MKRLTVVLVTIFSLSTLTVEVEAKQKQTLCIQAFTARTKVIAKHGKRAPGRNICRFGVREKVRHRWVTRDATVVEKGKYLRQLRNLIAPPPAYLFRGAGAPALPPAGTLSSHYAPSGVAACIVSRESGGNPQATNGQYGGIAQWSPEAWSRMGGTRYAGSPQGASYQQQLQVLSQGLARYGTGDWSPYDGC